MAVSATCLLSITLVCLLSGFQSVVTKEYVPVYMWGSPSDSSSSQPIPALTRISSDEFNDVLTKRLEHKVVVVFIEENLSVEDFSWQDALGQGSYPKLQSLAKSSKEIIYLPSVHAPAHILRGWSENWQHSSLYFDGLKPDVTQWNETLLFVNLLDAAENEDRPHLLKRHDSFMSDIYGKLLEKHDNVYAIYTAQHSSWQSDEDTPSTRRLRSRREAREGEDSYTMYNGNNQTYLYTPSPPTLMVQGKNFTLEGSPTVTLEPGAGEMESSLVVVYPTTPIVELRFIFRELSSNYWSLNDLEVSHGSENYTLTTKGIEAPFGFSYHCSQSVEFQDKPPTAEGEITSLNFASIQVQPQLEQVKEGEVPKFGDAYDCVYFMTAPILSGFFVTIIFAWIMGFGICMIMDIKTMDRFDDPKGKTIAINAAE